MCFYFCQAFKKDSSCRHSCHACVNNSKHIWNWGCFTKYGGGKISNSMYLEVGLYSNMWIVDKRVGERAASRAFIVLKYALNKV